jgi:hypothetical protein
MTTLTATRKLMKLTTADHGSLRLDFRVQVNPAGLVTVNGQAVGKSDTGRLQKAAQMLIGNDTHPDEAIMHVITSAAEAGQPGRISGEARSLPGMPGGVVIMVPVPRGADAA